ncbi:MAG: hypothetical protein VB934_19930 [Polyangiaceae bacterium]
MADRDVARMGVAYRRVVGVGLPLAWGLMVWLSACAQGVAVEWTVNDEDDGSSSVGGGGVGGMAAGGDLGAGGATMDFPCGVDCATIDAGKCKQATCDLITKTCIVGDLADNTVCDDGLFCTTLDTCSAGDCVGGLPNTCDLAPTACHQVICQESSQQCVQQPGNDGSPCQSSGNLCLIGTTCQNGLCAGGNEKDCFFSPKPDDCHVAVCNPNNGLCEPQPGNDGKACEDPSDLCSVGKTCAAGTCVGGVVKDCSGLTVGCSLGLCDPQSGQCGTIAVKNGEMCDDLDACTTGEICSNQSCSGGTPVTQCVDNDYCCPSGCDEMNDIDCASCDVNSALFPIAYTSSNSVGDMTFDAQCNLYWSTDGGEVFRLPKASQQYTTIHDFNSQTRGLVYNPNDNKLYAAVGGKVYSMTTTGQTVTLLASMSSWINGMEVAPGGWGAHAGKLIFGHSTGAVYALPTSGGTATLLGSTSGPVSDIVFDGPTLYAAAYNGKTIFKVSSTGTFTSLVSTSCNPDGLAVKENGELYFACGSSSSAYKVALPNGVPVKFASPSLSGGWAPVGMIYDGLDNVVIMENGMALKAYTP